MFGESQLGLAISDAIAERGRGILRSEATPCREVCLPQSGYSGPGDYVRSRSWRRRRCPPLAPRLAPN